MKNITLKHGEEINTGGVPSSMKTGLQILGDIEAIIAKSSGDKLAAEVSSYVIRTRNEASESRPKQKTPIIELTRLLDECKRNHDKLESCALPHHFPDEDLGYIPFQIHKCTKCGGEIDAHGLLWYNRGIRHGRTFK